MQCEQYAEDLSAYLDGELSRPRAAEVQSHLNVCRSCTDELRGLEQSAVFIQTHIRELKPQPEMWQHVRARLASTEQRPKARGFFNFEAFFPARSWVASTATLALFGLAILGYFRNEVYERTLQQTMIQYTNERNSEEQIHRRPEMVLPFADTLPNAAEPHTEYVNNPFVDVTLTTSPFGAGDR